MRNTVEFAVEPRSGVGKGAARKLRAGGRTPGVVYGPDMASRSITFREQDLVKALSTPAGRNVFLKLESDAEELDGTRVIVKDLQVEPLRREFIHADFYELDANREIHVMLPIHLEGTALGVKMGGIMSVARREVAVSCLPDNLPESISVDVSDLQPGQSIHVGDLVAPEGVTITVSSRLAVCAVVAPSGYDEEEEEGEEEGEVTEEGEGEEEAEDESPAE